MDLAYRSASVCVAVKLNEPVLSCKSVSLMPSETTVAPTGACSLSIRSARGVPLGMSRIRPKWFETDYK